MAKVLSSVSGNLISAASAGFAPTNSADVSAIASGYQVVSATATQLYAGTAYLTSVNDAPVSASRAGQAANASMANSAYYDGTGRLISALPDSAAVSSIASSYAESAASGKLDSTAQVVSATAGDGTYVTAINGMGLSGQGGGGAQVVTATGSASATAGFWPPFTTSYLVSSINGSALLPYGYSALSGNSGNWNNARTAVTANSAKWNSVYNTVSSNSASWGAGVSIPITGSAGDVTATYEVEFLSFVRNDTAGEPDIRTASLGTDQLYIDYTLDGIDHTSVSLTESMLDFMDSDGDHIVDAYSIDSWNSAVNTVANNSASWGGGATGDYVEKSALEVAIGSDNGASSISFVQGSGNSAYGHSFAQGYKSKAFTMSFAQGGNNSASNNSFAQGINNTASGYSFAQGNENSAKNTAAVFGMRNLRGDGDTATGHSAAFVIGDGTGMFARHDLMVVTKDGEITMYSSTADTTGTGIMSSIRAISAAATGGVDSATVSAIASSYAESAASSKQDYSAMSAYALSSDVSGCISAVSANSAFWAESGVDSATVSSIASSYAESAASAKMDTSAMTSYALSSDVSGTVDLVSTQSANWGGSALALSAGPGVTLTKSGSTLIAGLDETVLYSATAYAPGDFQQSYSLNETPLNFETVRVLAYRPLGNGAPWFGSVDVQIGNLYSYTAANTFIAMPYAFVSTANNIFYEGQYFINDITSTSWEDGSSTQRKTTETAYTTGYYAHIYKIIGINRTAGV